MSEPVVDRILRLFRERGDAAYLGEAVSQTEHALQSAFAAEQASAGSQLIAAALLHDIGHLLHGLPEDCAEHGIDDRHEELGHRFLLKHFGPAIAEPVRLHVAAKRYLCAVEADYLRILSPTSIRSLQLQGGPFSSEGVKSFAASPYCEVAVAVRRWDDIAKVPQLPTPGMEHYRAAITKCLQSA